MKKVSSSQVYSEALSQRCSVKKVFLEISQNSQESTCARVSFLIKLQFIKKRLWHRCFLVNFVELLRTHFFMEHLWWLLLFISINSCTELSEKKFFHLSIVKAYLSTATAVNYFLNNS